jgi:hypothetical protein
MRGDLEKTSHVFSVHIFARIENFDGP